jgi:hypothetical protein
LLFTDNETNNHRIFGTNNVSRYVKDGINNYVVDNERDAVNPEQTGTKAAAQYQLKIGAGETATIRLRLCDSAPSAVGDPFKSFAQTMQTRQREADEFYREITPQSVRLWLECYGPNSTSVTTLISGSKNIVSMLWFRGTGKCETAIGPIC